ncbi:uncharacterized protein LOC130649782 [Hydractinia symbiolongicarpus]|uniref:uncharacterized protein LOC130649782 n=1 Tax=Hydractinia symbiolongicarpus TaxID=13093 RepID=UPI00254CD2CE|nr:uncharacterized protein LOC130649782 [Hydractinia symbiolongicarpus]
MMRAARVFKCGRTSLQRSKETRNSYKTTKLKHELKKLERNDVIFVLDEQKGNAARKVLELHGRQYLQIRVNRADKTSGNQITLKICFNVHEDIYKYQKLLLGAIHFCDEAILFHSLEKHFKSIQTILSDAMFSNKPIRYEPLGRHFEMSKEMTVHHVENVTESLKQQLEKEGGYVIDLLRFSNCQLMETHMHAMEHLLMHVARLDLTGNDAMSPKALQVLSHDLLKAKTGLKSLNLSSCNLTDAHFVPMQPSLHVVEAVDLSYNEDLSPLAMKMITGSTQFADANMMTHNLSCLILNGCNLSDEHIKQLYRCVSRLHTLDLSGNTKLTCVAMKVLADAITESKVNKLKVLKLENCGILQPHIENLMHCIYLLQHLDLSWNVFSSSCVQLIAASILVDKDRKIESLNLTGCELADDHLSHVVDCMTALQTLHIGYNRDVSSHSVQLISEKMASIQKNSLKTLTLAGVKIKEDDISKLFNCAKQGLQNMDLTHCQLNNTHIANMAENISCFTQLYLCNNPDLTDVSAKVISDAITNNIENGSHLKVLSFKKCQLKDGFIECLAPCLKHLEVLDISYNPTLTPSAMKIISESLSPPSHLAELNISASGFKDSHFVNLNGCYVRLEKLDISANNLTYITLLAIKNDIAQCSPPQLKLKELKMYQAFCLRDYHYRKFENELKPYHVKVESI